MSLAGGFVNEGAGLGDPVVLEVSPVTTHRIPTHRANVVVRAQYAAGEALQYDAESSGRNIEVAGLEPNTICIWHPAPVIVDVDVGNEMFAAPAARIEAVGETVEGSDWHLSLPCLPAMAVSVSAPSHRLYSERPPRA